MKSNIIHRLYRTMNDSARFLHNHRFMPHFYSLPFLYLQHSMLIGFVSIAQSIVLFGHLSCAYCTNTLHIVVVYDFAYYILCFLSQLRNTLGKVIFGHYVQIFNVVFCASCTFWFIPPSILYVVVCCICMHYILCSPHPHPTTLQGLS